MDNCFRSHHKSAFVMPKPDYCRRNKVSPSLSLSLAASAMASSVASKWGATFFIYYGPLNRCVTLWVAHASGMPGTCGLATQTCITARAWRTCRDAFRDRWLAVSFEVVGRENVPGIPCAWATSNVTYLVRGPWTLQSMHVFHPTKVWQLWGWTGLGCPVALPCDRGLELLEQGRRIPSQLVHRTFLLGW